MDKKVKFIEMIKVPPFPEWIIRELKLSEEERWKKYLCGEWSPQFPRQKRFTRIK